MVSAPSFDPNVFVSGMSHEEAARLNDPQLSPLFNRASHGRYPPGSIFKVIVGAAILDAGVVGPTDTFRSEGRFRLRPGGRSWGDTAGPGAFDFFRAFYLSSNPYFSHYGMMVGPQNIVGLARQFGLGERTGLIGGMESPGYLPRPEVTRKRAGGRWMDGDTVNLTIGQGEIEVTPLQMAVMTAAVANGGKVYQPRLVAELVGQDSDAVAEVIRYPAGVLKNEVTLKRRTLELVQQAMVEDVEHPSGTGRRAAVRNFRVAGKTGTAQSPQGYVTWFVAYAPFENPRYAVAVVVEGGESGGSTCAPVAGEIFRSLQGREQQLEREARQRMAGIH
jgi:penicillin-binding protein 2